MKSGARTGLSVDPNLSVVTLDDSLAHRQSETRSRIRVPAVKSLEDREDSVGVIRVHADTVTAFGQGRLK